MFRTRSTRACLAVWLLGFFLIVGEPMISRAWAGPFWPDNACMAPPIPGGGCPANWNGCAGCAGTGWSCQSSPGGNCRTGPGGCGGGGCVCNMYSC